MEVEDHTVEILAEGTVSSEGISEPGNYRARVVAEWMEEQAIAQKQSTLK
jgi:hypothetical protein